MLNKLKFLAISLLLLTLFLTSVSLGQQPYRRGTTTGNFLEIGYGSRGNGMGDAVVASVNDLSSVYWNPAGLAQMRQSEALISHQPWIADINLSFAAAGLVVPQIGTMAISYYQVDYGREEVTTMDLQEGTGERFSANDMCLALSYGRKLAQWFSFGGSGKLISSNIWHTTATAFAVDLGAIVNTNFFSPTGERRDGLSIGMSISNYGTKMKFDGMDLLQPIDPDPYNAGNYDNVEGQYKTQGWELPLIFRIGAAVNPIVTANSKLTLEFNALHPNNNSESINVGAQYQYSIPTFGTFYLRTGYKGLAMPDSEYGMSFGAGTLFRMASMNNMAVRIGYAYRDVGLLGNTSSYTVSFLF